MNIFFPIETDSRELDFRLISASMLAQRGHKIYVGQHNFLNAIIPLFKRNKGLYVGKNFYHTISKPGDRSLINLYKSRGFDFVFFHEEGAFYVGDDAAWYKTFKSLFDANVLSDEDFIFTWGEKQQKIYQAEFPLLKDHVFNTGHPRFDLYKEKYRIIFNKNVGQLKVKYGDFILINTNLSLANHGQGLDIVFSEKFGFNKEKENLLKKIGAFTQQSRQLYSFIELIYHISLTFPDRKIIVRPHPSESILLYQKVFKHLDNVVVVYEGAVNSWILACKLLIHDGCTTAIEASLANKPVIDFNRFSNEEFEQKLPNSVGKKINDIEETLHEIKSIYESNESEALTQNTGSSLKSVFSNVDMDSFEVFVSQIDKIAQQKTSQEAIRDYSPDIAEIAKVNYKEILKIKLFKIKNFRNSNQSKNLNYGINKFPGFIESEAEKKMTTINKLLDSETKMSFVNNKLIIIG